VRALKFYSWTEVFESEIMRRRELQLDQIRRKAWWTVGMAVITGFTPIIVNSVSFSTYIGLGNTITLPNAFAVLVFFNMLKEPLWAVPDFLAAIADMMVSMNRIQEYLE